MSSVIENTALRVSDTLLHFVEREVLPGTGVSPSTFWQGLDAILADFTPANTALLAQRDTLQAQIDDWWREQRGSTLDVQAQATFLRQIGYLAPKPDAFSISTTRVDDEIAHVAGPQLVVPLSNARYALNAANARWGSLYDALYGTDALEPPAADATGYDSRRGTKVIAHARGLLDRLFPLASGRHADVRHYAIVKDELQITFMNGSTTGLANPRSLRGWRGSAAQPQAILLKRHGLHVEICIDRAHPIGKDDPAGISDVVLESALTTIQDCEDSVAAVDADDKVAVYRHWLGLMKGDLRASFVKSGRIVERTLNPDRTYHAPGGQQLTLPGRSLLLVRTVGHHMTTDAVLFRGEAAFETVVDLLVTATIALHDLRGAGRNSRSGSMYVVKPKLHGPDEVALANRLFDRVEDVLGLERNTLKMGVMDEERRTSVNLEACVAQVRERIVFINTGFLDRTGDEIHTAMQGGPMMRKEDIKTQPWLLSYERRNVRIGLQAGFSGRAQIGKGMWAMPDRMSAMLKTKGIHPAAGANCAWVPSPTAATLHAIHYHEVDVAAVQARLREEFAREPSDGMNALLVPPFATPSWSAAEIQAELDNNIQGILGYVVRWIDDGVGCSKVADINGVGLMEDRATLRISSQHVANWLKHGVCTPEQVEATLQRMAAIVDAQNAGTPGYRPMHAKLDASAAYSAARELVFKGAQQPNGYTESVLHRWRRARKASLAT